MISERTLLDSRFTFHFSDLGKFNNRFNRWISMLALAAAAAAIYSLDYKSSSWLSFPFTGGCLFQSNVGFPLKSDPITLDSESADVDLTW